MKPGSGIPHVTVGAVLFIIGGYLAWSFYEYDFGKMETTPWDSVVMFSVISILGLLILINGIKKIKMKK